MGPELAPLFMNKVYYYLNIILKQVIKTDAFKQLVFKLLAKLSIKITGISAWALGFVIDYFGPKLAEYMVRKSMLAYDIMEGRFKVRALKAAEENNDESAWNYISDSL